MLAVCSVRTNVGETAFTLIPYLAHSVACWRVRALIAPLAATYAEYPALRASCPRTEPRLRMHPPLPALIIARTAAWDGSSVVRRLRSTMRSHSDSGYSSAG